LSLSKKKAVISTVVGILAVSLFAAALFYVVPSSSRTGPIVFAMGAFGSSSQDSTVYSLAFDLNVTFLNGTSWDSRSTTGGLYSTDISKVQFMPLPSYIGNAGVPGPFVIAFQFVHDYQVLTGVTGETTLNLGMLDVVNFTDAGYASLLGSQSDFTYPANFTAPPRLNYTYQVNCTGFWRLDQSYWSTLNNTGSPPPYWGQPLWAMTSDQIQSILVNTTDTVNIAFNLDMNSIVYYTLYTPSGTQMGTASVQYSGPWGTLELFHEGDQLLGFQYNFSNVVLTLMSS